MSGRTRAGWLGSVGAIAWLGLSQLAACSNSDGKGDETQQGADGGAPVGMQPGADGGAPVGMQPGADGTMVDLLFVIDNSDSMAQEQAKLVEVLPRLLRTLTTGVTEGGRTFKPASDLHVGVVTTDMGTSGSAIVISTSCGGESGRRKEGFGDDGLLVKASDACDIDVAAGYINYVPASLPASQREAALQGAIDDISCLAQVGVTGCGIEQPLEAAYKALAPASLKVFAGGTGGHGDVENNGFLRPEATLAIVHVSDEDDCSVTDEGVVIFDRTSDAPGVLLPGNGARLGLNLRCSFAGVPRVRVSQAEEYGYLHDADRYITEFKNNVKPLHPERVVFAAIVGIPEDTENAPFESVLADARLNFAIDLTSSQRDPTSVRTVPHDACRRCIAKSETECLAEPYRFDDGLINPEIITAGKPPQRFVKVAQGFGENGLLRSICAETYAPAVDAIAEKIFEVGARN